MASQRDNQNDRNELPESAMGGASDSGAHGRHPASSPEAAREGRPAEPELAPGDAAIERRRRHDPAYRGPERRIGAGAEPD